MNQMNNSQNTLKPKHSLNLKAGCTQDQYNIEGYKVIDARNEYVVRMFQCRTCKQFFKQSQGVLFISGFFCDDHNPKRFS